MGGPVCLEFFWEFSWSCFEVVLELFLRFFGVCLELFWSCFVVFSVVYKVLRNFDPPDVPAGATHKFRIFNYFSSSGTRNSLESLSFVGVYVFDILCWSVLGVLFGDCFVLHCCSELCLVCFWSLEFSKIQLWSFGNGTVCGQTVTS